MSASAGGPAALSAAAASGAAPSTDASAGATLSGVHVGRVRISLYEERRQRADKCFAQQLLPTQ